MLHPLTDISRQSLGSGTPLALSWGIQQGARTKTPEPHAASLAVQEPAPRRGRRDATQVKQILASGAEELPFEVTSQKVRPPHPLGFRWSGVGSLKSSRMKDGDGHHWELTTYRGHYRLPVKACQPPKNPSAAL